MLYAKNNGNAYSKNNIVKDVDILCLNVRFTAFK